MCKGFSTIELLIAMAVLALVLGAIALLAFGDGSLLSDEQVSAAALGYAETLLANEQALAAEDFALLAPATTTATIGSTTYTAVATISQPQTYEKDITINVTWNSSYQRTESLSLMTSITDYSNATNARSCSSTLTGDWSAPSIKNAITSFPQLVNDASGNYLLTGAAAYKGKLYITQSNPNANKETFFIFDVSTPSNPTLITKLDNDTKQKTGLSSVALSSSSAGTYAYVASASSFSSGQLQIINVTNPSAPSLITTYKIPTSIVPTAGLGKTVTYDNGYVYLGLTKTSNGDEFNIIDVHNPLSPQWVGGYSVGNDINSIYIEGTRAYIASPHTKNLLVLDISNPQNPTLLGGYTATGGSNGEVVQVLGNTAYLGRTFGNNEFYALDVIDPANISSLGTLDLGNGNNTSVQGMVIRQYLAFVVNNSQFEMIRIDNPASLALFGAQINLPSGSGGTGITLVCDGDYLYALSNSSNNGFLSVFHP